MAYSLYTDPYKSPADTFSDLCRKGLTCSDPSAAVKFLERINYSRFKIYLRPFLDVATGKYSGSFEDGVELYRFDDALRDLLFSYIGRLEVKLRTRLDHTVSSYTNNPFWYLDDSLFAERRSLSRIRAKIGDSVSQSKDEQLLNFKENHYNDQHHGYKHLPPFWLAVETTTFGDLNTIYRSLNKKRFLYTPRKNKLLELAAEFGAPSFDALLDWLTCIRDVRNRCAHHSRLWNYNSREPKAIVPALSIPPAKGNRVYLFIALLHKIDSAMGISMEVPRKVKDLISDYPGVQTCIDSAGFPTDWHTDSFWA